MSPVVYPSQAVQQKHYPSLNGLRGISIILVVLSHLHLSSAPWFRVVFNGSLGVNIFFVLSGFLITTLCIREIEATGDLSLRKFYTRRFLRIFPVAYLYLAVVLLLGVAFHLGIKWFQLAGAALYVMNFSYFRAHDFTWLVSHYWSLSVEEQFYIIFPFILKQSRRIFTWCLAFISAGLLFVCAAQAIFAPLNHGLPYFFSHYFIKFQSIAVGCLFAVLTFRKAFDLPLLGRTKLPANVIALVIIFVLRYDEFYSLKAVVTNCIISVLTGYLVISNLAPSRDLFFRFLNLKLLSAIGVLSYSIYIWQQLFTSGDPRLPYWMVTQPFNLIWIVIVPVVSYYGFERYFLRIKKRFKVVKAEA